MKAWLAAASAGIVLVTTAIIVTAHAPGITVNPIGPLEIATFPHNQAVSGTASHTQELPPAGLPGDNVCALNALEVVVTDGGAYEETILDQGNPAAFFGWTCDQTVANWNTTWSIPGPGTFTITAEIRHGGDENDAQTEVIVTQVTVDCPAAPSIAAHYLKSEDVKPGSSEYKNIVSQVAQHMGPQTDFDGVGACDDDYADTVENFVDGILSSLGLP